MESAFEARRLELQGDPAGGVPEKVLVLETVGSVQGFIDAVRRISGMEWLGEWDEEDIPPDEDFYADEDHRDKLLGGRLFLVMTNQQALNELLSMWARYQRTPDVPLEDGRTKWRDLFRHLRKIRPWGVEDRLTETGVLEVWRERTARGEEIVRFETELWFRQDAQDRRQRQQTLTQLLEQEGGRLIGHTIITEIGYHGVLAELPMASITRIIEHQDTHLVRCDDVMFFRPIGQTIVAAPEGEPLSAPEPPETLPIPQGNPIIALLDGLPLEQHQLLAGRLIVHDPDGWSTDYPAKDRCHGTAMASLLVHGDLGANENPLKRPVYVRPILKPNPHDFRPIRSEYMPENELPVDLVHRIVRAMFEATGGEPPVASTVRIINFSVGDPSRLFDRFISPLARLLDWLSWKYQVLFTVSAGNHTRDITLDFPHASFASIPAPELEKATIQALANDARNRRLLTPAEAINALTIGSLHEDASVIPSMGPLTNLLSSPSLPSPINALGLGLRRAVKPEILMPGGRVLYRAVNSHPKTTLTSSPNNSPPGQLAATPGSAPGVLNARRFFRGTSNSTALVTRTCERLYDMLGSLRREPGGEVLAERFTTVLLKTLLVHSASWGDAYGTLSEILKTSTNSRTFKEYVSRFLGFGTIDPNRVFNSTEQRATVLGCNVIRDGATQVYSLPVPPSLSGRRIWKRLTITLAWLTPVNPAHRHYRRAALWIDPPKDDLNLSRQNVDWRAVKRGTVQHEVLEGEAATAFSTGHALDVRVNCRADAGDCSEDIPYAVAVTLEVAEGQDVPIYEEIRARIRPPVPISPIGRTRG